VLTWPLDRIEYPEDGERISSARYGDHDVLETESNSSTHNSGYSDSDGGVSSLSKMKIKVRRSINIFRSGFVSKLH
jgi:hypothetical protein